MSSGPRPASQYLLSFLARQYALLSHRFLHMHVHPWLVWEAREGAESVLVARSAAKTCLPGDAMNRAVSPGDALCFELARDGTDKAVRYYIGYSDGEIIVSLRPAPRCSGVVAYAGGWRAETSSGATGLSIGGAALAPGTHAPLADGAVLELDGLKLTFLSAIAFAQRVQARAAKL